MAKQPLILIICDVENQRHWGPMLAEIRNSLGPVSIVLEKEALEKGITGKFDLVVIDISRSVSLTRLVEFVREHQKESKILIVSAAPTWKKARQAFYVGATDYIPKQYSIEATIAALQVALRTPHAKAN